MTAVARTEPFHANDWPLETVAASVSAACDLISEGASLRSVAEQLQIPVVTLYQWLQRPANSERYARAKEMRAEMLASELIALSDTALTNDPQAVRVQVDTRKWVMSKFMPRVYGDKITQEHTGEVQVKAALIHFTRQDLPK